MILRHFDRGAKLSDNSNRYEHTCKRCGEKYPKGRSDALINHILKKCSRITADERKKAFIEHGNLPDDGTYFMHGQLQNGQQGEVPNGGNNWNALQVLAEVSRNFEQPLNSARNAGPHNGAPNQLQIIEHFTPDNPPVSFEQRGSRDKKGTLELHLYLIPLTDVVLEQIKRERNSIHPGDNMGDGSMDLTYHGMSSFGTGDGDMSGPHHVSSYRNIEPQLHQGQFVPSRSSSPNFSMAQRATTIAQAAAANFAPSMVDPDILRDEAALNARNVSATAERLFAQQIQEANAAMPDAYQPHSPQEDHSAHWPVEEDVADDTFSEHQNSVQHNAKYSPPPVGFQLEQVAYRPIVMGSEQNPVQAASLTGAFSAEPGDGVRHNGKQKVRGAFSGARRVEVQEIRKQGACIRCKILKKSCSLGTPCRACASVDSARVWKQPCSRRRLVQEMDMFGAGLHHTLMNHKLDLEKAQFEFRPSSVQIEASHHPEVSIFASFPVNEGSTPAISQIDPGLDNQLSHETVYQLDTDNIDIGAKIEAYARQMRDVFFEHEPSNFMRVTLGSAADALTHLDEKESRLLLDVMDLWCMVHILVDHEVKWVLTQRTNTHTSPDSLPTVNDRSWRLINSQLSAAVEKKACLLTRSVLQVLETRLQSPKARRSFELFLVGIIILNCLRENHLVL